MVNANTSVLLVTMIFLQMAILASIRTLLQSIVNHPGANLLCDTNDQSSSVNAGGSGRGTENIFYGHIHMAKTAGSTVNGELANRFTRVCGHKGYSYDAMRKKKKSNNDTYSNLYKGFNRGRVPWAVMDEIGFEECDLFSTEEGWWKWKQRFGKWPFPVEIHLPCRDPIDHLMSQCNFLRNTTFDCNNATTGARQLADQVDKCIIYMNRFSKELKATFPIKCYDALNIQGYLEYMGERLQTRKIVGNYTFRPFNKPRHKRTECVWQDPKLMKDIKDYLADRYDYYDFCMNECMGSENELPLPNPTG